jgi:uncharacterized protein (UPF0276 family)
VSLIGAGYRPELHSLFRREPFPTVDCAEVIADRYIASHGFTRIWELAALDGLPVLLHGVSGNVASTSGPDLAYLDQIALLADLTSAALYSDHLAFTGTGRHALGHLAPNLFDDELLELAATHIATIRHRTGYRVVLENLATSVEITGSRYTPEEFYLHLLDISDDWECLVDLTNLWINSQNRSVDTLGFITSIPPNRIRYVHLAGGRLVGGEWVDTHSERVHEAVIDLLETLLRVSHPEFLVVERDSNWDGAEQQVRSDLNAIRSLVSKMSPQALG